MQHISDLHSKFALGPHHVSKYGIDIHSATAEIRRGKKKKLECGPMPNVMAALQNIGDAFCSTPQSLADAHSTVPCSNAAKTRNPLKFGGVPQTPEPISAVSGPKFTILSGHVEEVLLFNTFFRLSIYALVPKV